MRRSASSPTNAVGSARTMPPMPHTSIHRPVRFDDARRRVQVRGRRAPAANLPVRRFDVGHLELHARRKPRGLDVVNLAPHQEVHPFVWMSEVKLLLRLWEGEGLSRGLTLSDCFGQAEVLRERVDLGLEERRNRLDVRK